ncbi:MAG: right-handed parallel beta-helix repeat-containing protein [Lachnospiraceae bacterium]|nr:right-handed parallel beta-helix repeat-containing protein [Lachnospiraceae bacterium]
MKRRFCLILIFLFIFAVLSSVSLLPVYAATEPAHAPGGTVRSAEDFAAALGGETNVRIESLSLRRDLTLDSPIVIEEGSYVLNGAGCEIRRGFDEGDMIVVKHGASLDLGKTGAIGSDASLILTGNDKGKAASLIRVEGDLNLYGGTVLSGQGSSGRGACFCVKENGMLNIYGGEITDCVSTVSGGAIFTEEGGILNIADVTIKNCTAPEGGAISINGRGALLGGTVENCTADTYGGGIFVHSAKVTLGGILCKNCTASLGGGAYVTDATVLNGFSANGCSAERGGGLYLMKDAVSAGFSISSCHADDGAGIYTEGQLTLEAGYFSENTAANRGGCIYISGSGSVIHHDCTFISGTAKYGGGIYNRGTLDMSGGGFMMNKADCGSAVCSEGTVILRKSVIVSKGSHIALVRGDLGGTIRVEGKLTAPAVSELVPAVMENDVIRPDYTVGTVILEGTEEDVKDAAGRFSMTDANGKEYAVSEKGELKKKVTVPVSDFLYVGIGILLLAGIGTGVFLREK